MRQPTFNILNECLAKFSNRMRNTSTHTYRPHIHKTHLAQRHSKRCRRRATPCIQIIRILIRIRTILIPRRTRRSRAIRVIRRNSKSRRNKLRVRVEIDRRQIPPECALALGVLELQDAVLAGGRGHFDGDATVVGVGAPLLGVGAAVGG